MINFSREWAMPNKDTFSIFPIKNFVNKYLEKTKISVDPFARNKNWFTHTNDLNTETSAQFHLDAIDFSKVLKAQNVTCDLLVLDPPYSVRQTSECYSSIGKKVSMQDTQSSFWKNIRNAFDPILNTNGICLSFGWNTVGMWEKKRGYEILEIMLVCHGGAHNDTICIAERKK